MTIKHKVCRRSGTIKSQIRRVGVSGRKKKGDQTSLVWTLGDSMMGLQVTGEENKYSCARVIVSLKEGLLGSQAEEVST